MVLWGAVHVALEEGVAEQGAVKEEAVVLSVKGPVRVLRCMPMIG